MRKNIIQLLSLVFAGSLFVAGCAQHRAAAPQPRPVDNPGGGMVVLDPPPEPRKEFVSVSPDQEHIWVQGYWTRGGDRWVWIPGHWERRPQPSAVWVPGHWDKHPTSRGWIWTGGHWE